MLGFSLLAGFIIVNYDIIKTFKWKDFEIETFQQEVSTIKTNALESINSEITSQKESINFLISNANDATSKIENQRNSLNNLIDVAKELTSKIEIQKIDIQNLNEQTVRTKNEIKMLNDASAQIALILVRATYLTLQTKHEFGTERAKKAIKEVEKDLNTILPMVLPDATERSAWVNRLKQTLPPKQ